MQQAVVESVKLEGVVMVEFSARAGAPVVDEESFFRDVPLSGIRLNHTACAGVVGGGDGGFERHVGGGMVKVVNDDGGGPAFQRRDDTVGFHLFHRRKEDRIGQRRSGSDGAQEPAILITQGANVLVDELFRVIGQINGSCRHCL